MTSERWLQIEQLYHAAVALDAAARSAFLEQHCKDDPELRQEVESLLDNDAEAQNFIESPALQVAADLLTRSPIDDLSGRDIGHYRILSLLGGGGMGVVYKAEDVKLGRVVALKFLPQDAAYDREAVERFRREASAASALDHPNICTIYEIDECEGRPFIAMQFLEGRTLKHCIAEHSVDCRWVPELGSQIADALNAAHSKGIIHRDIKPANIFVTTSKQAKLLDFGLAKMVRPKKNAAAGGEHNLTNSGRTLGTVAYMSPEQVLGKPLDGRSDLFSFGVTLYETVTGALPFNGDSPGAVFDAILHKVPIQPRLVNPEVSIELQDIINKALEKDPRRRFEHAFEMRDELNRIRHASTLLKAPTRRTASRVLVLVAAFLGTLLIALAWRAHLPPQLRSSGGSSHPIQSLAVLPLANLSGDPAQDYFVDGMTDELITQLAKQGDVRVISRTSIMTYKLSHKSLPEIAKELNVDAVVEGSVQRSGDRVRIRTQLIRADTDEHIWAESYDREIHDVLRLQSDAAKDIVHEIHAKLHPNQGKYISATHEVDPAVYDLYLRGRYHWNKRTKEDLERAIGYFNAAIAKQPNYAAAYAGLADCYNLSGSPRGAAVAERALALDESLGEAHASLAYAKQNYEWNFVAAEREFKRALELNPNYSTAYQWYAAFLTNMGRHQEALSATNRALQLDPLSVNTNTAAGVVYYFARDFDRAERQFKRALSLDPKFYSAHVRLAQVHLLKGRYDDYLSERQTAAALSGRPSEINRVAAMTEAYAHSGLRAMFLKELELLAHDESKPDLPAATLADRYLIAQDYAHLGDRERAFQYLEKGFRVRGFEMLVLKNDPQMDTLRSDPRFTELMRRVGLPE